MFLFCLPFFLFFLYRSLLFQLFLIFGYFSSSYFSSLIVLIFLFNFFRMPEEGVGGDDASYFSILLFVSNFGSFPLPSSSSSFSSSSFHSLPFSFFFYIIFNLCFWTTLLIFISMIFLFYLFFFSLSLSLSLSLSHR